MPCCIDRMRFSPRISIRRKEVLLLFFISFFFEEYGTCLQLELSDLAIFVGRTYYATTYPPTAAVAFTGGSSAVEQRTVKCLRSNPLVGSSNLPLRTFCSDGLLHRVEVRAEAGPMSYGHTTVKAPYPI